MTSAATRSVLIFLLVIGCSERERTNPLDPNNPVTKGAPVGLEVVTILDAAIVNWGPFNVDDLTSYRVYRWTDSDTPSVRANISSQISRFLDFNLTYDQKYYYAVQAITVTHESEISAPDSAIPGPNNFLIIDLNDAALKRVAYDGSHIISQVYVNAPVALVAEPNRNRFWVADFWNRTINIFANDLTVEGTVELSGSPLDLAMAADSRRVYCLQINPDTIIVSNLLGDLVNGLDIPEDLNLRSIITVDEIAGQVWLGLPDPTGEGRLYRTDYRLRPTMWHTAGSFANLQAIVADPVNGGVWVAAQGGVAHVSPNSQPPVIFAADVNVFDISLNPDNGDCYFIGQQGSEGSSVVGRIGSNLDIDQITVNELPVGELTRLQSLAGEGPVGFLAWQASEGRLLRFTYHGERIGGMDGVTGVKDLALE